MISWYGVYNFVVIIFKVFIPNMAEFPRSNSTSLYTKQTRRIAKLIWCYTTLGGSLHLSFVILRV